MINKICLITGASSGIGKITAIELAKMGAEVAIVCRSEEQAQVTCNEIRSLSNNNKVGYLIADLGSLNSVARLAKDVITRFTKIDVLINNAGILNTGRKETIDGIEAQWQINYLSHFFLTLLLTDQLKSSGAGRIINVSSEAHRWTKIDFNDLESSKSYNGLIAYGRSKLAQIYFTYQLSEIFAPYGITVNALHPGFVSTNINRGKGLMNSLFEILSIFFAVRPEKGAETSIFLSASDQVENITGKYFIRYKAKNSSKASYDKETAKKLWEQSLTLLSYSYPY